MQSTSSTRKDLTNASTLLRQLANLSGSANLTLNVLTPLNIDIQKSRSGKLTLKLETDDQFLIECLLLELASIHQPDPNVVYEDDPQPSIDCELALSR